MALPVSTSTPSAGSRHDPACATQAFYPSGSSSGAIWESPSTKEAETGAARGCLCPGRDQPARK